MQNQTTQFTRNNTLKSALAIMVCTCTVAWTTWSYTVEWHSQDGGGGTSSSKDFSISGTLGQVDAGPCMTGGTFVIEGGFWAMPTAIQTPGLPTIRIAPASPGFATISWHPSPPGLVLQSNDTLSPITWTNAPSGTTNPAMVPAALPQKFYRLFQP